MSEKYRFCIDCNAKHLPREDTYIACKQGRELRAPPRDLAAELAAATAERDDLRVFKSVNYAEAIAELAAATASAASLQSLSDSQREMIRKVVGERDAARAEREKLIDNGHWLTLERERLAIELTAARAERDALAVKLGNSNASWISERTRASRLSALVELAKAWSTAVEDHEAYVKEYEAARGKDYAGMSSATLVRILRAREDFREALAADSSPTTKLSDASSSLTVGSELAVPREWWASVRGVPNAVDPHVGCLFNEKPAGSGEVIRVREVPATTSAHDGGAL